MKHRPRPEYKRSKQSSHYYQRKQHSRRSESYSAQKSVRSDSSKLSQANSSSSTDKSYHERDADHFTYKVGDKLKDRFVVIKHLGDGTFGRTLQCENTDDKKYYAVKVSAHPNITALDNSPCQTVQSQCKDRDLNSRKHSQTRGRSAPHRQIIRALHDQRQGEPGNEAQLKRHKARLSRV